MSVLTGVLLPPGTTGSRPAAAGLPEGTLYPSTDDLIIYQVESAAWVVWADYSATGGGGVATDPIWDVKGDLAGATGANAASRLPVGSNGQVLSADSGEATGLKWIAAGSFDEDLLPWLIDINVFSTAIANTTWDTVNAAAGFIGGGDKRNGGLQNSVIAWDVVLAAGTWSVLVMAAEDANRGILTVKLDATTVGTIDYYNAANNANVRKVLTGVVVGTTGKTRLSFTTSTKNASSSGYWGTIQHVTLQRTA